MNSPATPFMSRSTSRRRALQLAGLAGTSALLLPACSTSSAPGTGASSGQKTVRYWTFMESGESDDARTLAQAQIIEAFEAANPDIKIQEEIVPWNELHSQLLRAAASGQAPDISRQLDQYVATLARAEAIVPVDDYVADMGDDVRDDFLYAWDDTVVDEKKYGFRQSIRVANMQFFRPAQFASVGLQAPPTTVTDWTDAIAEIRGTDGSGFAMPMSKADNLNRVMQVIPSFYWALGADLVDESGNPTFHEDEGQAIFSWLQDLVHVHGIAPADELVMDSESEVRRFKGGGTISSWHHSSQWSEYADLRDSEDGLGWATLPNIAETDTAVPASTEGGWTLCMSAAPENRDAAWKFMEFMHSTEAELIDATVGGELPTRQSTLEADDFFDSEDFARQREWLNYLGEHAHPASSIKITKREALADALADALQRIIGERASVSEELATAAEAYRAAL